MQRKWRIVIGIILILSLLVSLSLTIYYLVLPRFYQITDMEKYLYPNPLWNGSMSDMVVENDDNVHFILPTTITEGDIDITYAKLNFEDNSTFFLSRHNGSILTHYHDIRIGLTVDKKPLIYLFQTTGFLYEIGEILTINSDTWIDHPSFEKLPYNLTRSTRGPLLNWDFSSTGKINIAYIYVPPFALNGSTPEITTPVIYNETSKEAIFLHEIFPEIASYNTFAPGDFKISEEMIFVMWERYFSSDLHYPCLAIYWPTEGWMFHTPGIEFNTTRPIAIFPQKDEIRIFSYDPGLRTNISRIYMTRLFNSSYSISEEIVNFQGNLFFYQDAMHQLSDDRFLFIYVRRPYLPELQLDLFLGYYDGIQFKEIQLTNTSNYSEYYAHLDISNNYLHYAWTRWNYTGSRYYNPKTSRLFYDRLLLIDLESFLTTNTNINSVENFETIKLKLKLERLVEQRRILKHLTFIKMILLFSFDKKRIYDCLINCLYSGISTVW